MTLNAEYYHENSSRQQALAYELLAGFQFQQTDCVLDVGCGDGKVTFQ